MTFPRPKITPTFKPEDGEYDILNTIREERKKAGVSNIDMKRIIQRAMEEMRNRTNQHVVVNTESVRVVTKRPCGSKLTRRGCPDCGSEMFWAPVNTSSANQVGGDYKSQTFCMNCGYEEFNLEEKFSHVRRSWR